MCGSLLTVVGIDGASRYTRAEHCGNIVTMHCLAAVFDAVVRLPSREPLVLTQIMHPQAEGEASRTPAWFPSMTTFAGMDLATRTATMLVTDPRVARARHAVIAYWDALHSVPGAQPVLDTPDRMLYPADHPTIAFVQELVAALGRDVLDIPHGSWLQTKIDSEVALASGDSVSDQSRLERVGRWLASEWDECPEFAQLRSLVILTKWSMERMRTIATAPLWCVAVHSHAGLAPRLGLG